MTANESIDVLVVDDQPGVRYLLEVLIKGLGHNTFGASNGLEAVASVQKFKPSLIFMDVQMPVMDGLQALGRIKKMYPQIEVVILTANYTQENITKASRLGAAKIIAKPFDVDEIRDIIDDYLVQIKIEKTENINHHAL